MQEASDEELLVACLFFLAAVFSIAWVSRNHKDTQYINSNNWLWVVYTAVTTIDLVLAMMMAGFRIRGLAYAVCAASVLSCAMLFAWSQSVTAMRSYISESDTVLLIELQQEIYAGNTTYEQSSEI